MSFTHVFRGWVEAGLEDRVKRGLQFIEAITPAEEDRDWHDRDDLRNGVLACFLENVLDDSGEVRTLVLPNLGPKLREHLAQYEPHWLEQGRPGWRSDRLVTTDRLLAVIISLALIALGVYVAWVLSGDFPMTL